MKQFSGVFKFFVILLLFGASCSTPASTHWWTSWLSQPVCKTPCWMNITPGKTSQDEALLILKNTPDIAVTYKDKYGIDFRFRQTKTDSGVAKFSKNKIVAVVHLGNSTDGKLPLDMIMASYNKPSFVELYDCREGMCSTAIVYPDIGLLVDLFLEEMGNKDIYQVNIQPGDVVSGVCFFEPGLEIFLNWPDFQGHKLLEWKGYGQYP